MSVGLRKYHLQVTVLETLSQGRAYHLQVNLLQDQIEEAHAEAVHAHRWMSTLLCCTLGGLLLIHDSNHLADLTFQ